jgi:hypothetical protein
MEKVRGWALAHGLSNITHQHYLAREVCPAPWASEEDDNLRAMRQELDNDWAIPFPVPE